MAKLPTRDDLGALPSARSGRAIARVDLGATARAQQGLGAELVNFSAVLNKKQSEADEFETERRFQEFKFEREKELDEQMRSVEPGQADGFQDRYAQSYQERAREFFAGVPDSLKPKYDMKLFGAERDLYGSAATFARGEQKRVSVNALEDHKNRVALSGDLDRAKADYDDLLSVNPFLSPIEKDEVRRKHLEEIEEQNIEWRIRRGDDLDEIIRDLEDPQAGAAPSPRAAIETHSDGMATVTTGSEAKFRVSGQYADRFAGALADLEAAGVAADPSQSGGYADRNIRGTNVRSRHASGEAIDINWRDNAEGTPGKIDPKLARSIAQKWGLKWGGDFKKRSSDPMHFEVDRSIKEPVGLAEAPVAERGLTQYAGLEKKTSDDAGAELPSLEAKAKYASLSPQRRAALVYKAKTALSAKTQQAVDDDIERIRKTGQVRVGPDGVTSLDRARRFLTPNQVAAKQIEWQEAEMEYQAVSPLTEMTEDEATAHLTGLIPSSELEGQSYESAVKVEKTATDTWKKIAELRKKDPAKAVEDFPEVQRVREEIAAAQGQSDEMQVPGLTVTGVELDPVTVNAKLIAARKEAQRRIGLRDWEMQPITITEGKELLAMPDPSAIDDPGEYHDGLVNASNRADELYGPHAYEALKAAIAFTRRDKEEKEIAAGVLANMARGEPVSEGDVRRAQEAQSAYSAERAFSPLGPGFAPQVPDVSRPGLMQAEPGKGVVPFGPPKPSGKPNDAQLQWLMADPEKRAKVFDRQFGAGAAAKALGKKKPNDKGGEGKGPFRGG